MSEGVLNDEPPEKNNPHTLSRRNFLKVAGLSALSAVSAVGGYLLGRSPLTQQTTARGENKSEQSKEIFTPRIIHEVPVYGVESKLTSPEQILSLYHQLDDEFSKKNGIKIGNKLEQRKELLNPNERYLEVVVRQSAYDSFTKRQAETGADFVEWIKMHVDVLNRCIENTEPSSKMRAVLDHIVVIDDRLPDQFWSEEQFKGNCGCNLDFGWLNYFYSAFPLNIDESWAIPYDYRTDEKGDQKRNVPWYDFEHRFGKTVFGFGAGLNIFNRTFEFPEKSDSLENKDKVWLDFGLTHEWSHYLLNLPDEYGFNISEGPFRIKNFYFDTGYFECPYMSPFLTCLLNRQARTKSRDILVEGLGKGYSYSERPDNITLTATSSDGSPISNISIHKVHATDSYIGKKVFSEKPDIAVEGNNVSLDENIFAPEKGTIPPHVWLLRCESKGIQKELFLPSAFFNMTKWQVGCNKADYIIEFTGQDNPDFKTQTVELVNEADLNDFVRMRQDGVKILVYAKMKVVGTSIFFVWMLKSDVLVV